MQLILINIQSYIKKISTGTRKNLENYNQVRMMDRRATLYVEAIFKVRTYCKKR